MIDAPNCARCGEVIEPDARRLGLIKRFPDQSDFFSVKRCYENMKRHVEPHHRCSNTRETYWGDPPNG